MQAGFLDGQVVYTQITADGAVYFEMKDGELQRVEQPAIESADGTELSPVRTGNAVWFPQQLEDGSIIWTRWVNGEEQVYAGDPRQD